MAWEWSTLEYVFDKVDGVINVDTVRAVAVGNHKGTGHLAIAEDNRNDSHNVVNVDISRSIYIAMQEYFIRGQYPLLPT